VASRIRSRLRNGGGSVIPANVSAPEFTGAMTTGKTLTVVPGTWAGDPTLTYQWKANGSNIVGATNTTYILQAAEEGADITVVESDSVSGTSATSAARGPVQSETDIVAEVETDLTAASVWSKLDAIWLLQSTEALSKVNLKNPGTFNLAASGVGTPTWTAGSGFRSVSNGVWSSGFNPTTAASPNFTQDSNHLFLFCATDAVNTVASMGADTVALNPRTTNTTDYNFPTRHRNGISGTPVNTGGHQWDALGTHLCTRDNSSTWWTGREGEFSLEHTQASNALGNFDIYFAAYNAGSIQRDTTRYFMAGSIGSALTQANALALHKAVTKCLVKLGHITPKVEAPVTGVPQSTSVKVAADIRWGYAGMQTRLVVATSADTNFTNPVFRGDVETLAWAGAKIPVMHEATGLSASTAYRARIEILGYAPNSTDNPVVTFTTAPSVAAGFSFALASCSNVHTVTTTAATGQAELVFEAMASMTSLKFWRHLGDFHYDDNVDADAVYLAKLAADPTALKRNSRYYVRGFLKYGFVKAVNAFLPLHMIPDDHDFVFNDYTNNTAITGSDYATCAAAANTALKERIPGPATLAHSSLHAGVQDYGPYVRFLTMDTRTQRRITGTGSVLGNASDTFDQVQWVKDQVTDASADGIKLLFIDCSCTWTGSANDGFGFDADWAVERTSLADHFKTVLDANTGMKIIMLVGDMHRFTADDGSTSGVFTTGATQIPRFIEIVGSPLNSTVLDTGSGSWDGVATKYAPGTSSVDYAQLVTTIEVDAANEHLTIKNYDCATGSAVLQATYSTTDLADWQ
jgi:hypothetical protein